MTFGGRLLRALGVCAGLAAAFAPAASPAAQPARIVSLNMCTDQLLLDLADPGQVAGLSPYAGSLSLSWAANRSGDLPLLSGTAEEVMVIRPDLVVAGRFTARATREFIRAHGIPLEEFDVTRNLDEAKAQILRFGELTGATERARQRVAAIDAAATELRAAAATARFRVLPLSRRGWVPGRETLMTDLLATAGLVNVAGEAGLDAGGFLTLEQVVRLRPDAILVSRDDDRAEDQGRAMLLHPAIERLFPPERRIVLPERLTVCGGPMVVEAMSLLAAQLRRLSPRPGGS